MTLSFRRPIRRILTGSIAAVAALVSTAAKAQTWNGGGGDDNWGTGANWVGGIAPGTGTGITVNFDGSIRLTPFFNYSAYDQMGSIFFNSGAGAFTLSGNSIKVFSKIENSSTVLQTVSFDNLVLNGTAATEINPVLGDLLINSPIFMDTPELRVYGNNGKTVTFGGLIANGNQSGGFALLENSTAVFTAANTYSGNSYVSAGRLQFAQGGSANNSTVYLGDTGGTAAAEVSITDADGGTASASTLVVRAGSSGVKTISATNTSGTNTFSGDAYLDADVTTLSNSTGATLAFTGGTFDLKNQTLTVSGAGNTTIAAGLSNSIGAGKLTKTDAGTLTLTGASTRSSASAATQVNGGVLSVQHNDALGTNGTANTIPVTVSNSGSILEIKGSGLVLNDGLFVTLNNGATFRSDGSNATNARIAIPTSVSANSVTIATVSAGDVFTLGNGTNDITGGDGTDDTINVSGPGTVLAAVSSDYIGNWSVNAGTLRLGATAASGAGATGKITLNGGNLSGFLSGNTTFTGPAANGLIVTADSTLTSDLSSGTVGVTYTYGPLSIGGQTLTTARGAGLAGTGGLTVGAVTLTGAPTFALGANTLLTMGAVTGTNTNLTFNGTGAAAITGVIGTGSGALNVNGGTVTLSNTGNTFTGAVNVDGSGVIVVPGNAGAAGDPTALGGGSKAINLTNGGTIRVTSSSNPTGTNTKMFTFGTGGGRLDVNSGITLTLDDNTGAAAQLQGAGDLTKIGAGTLQLGYSGQVAGGFSGFTGNIIVSTGTLQVGNANGLGSNVTGTTTVQSGAVLDFYSANFAAALAEPITINGTGISSGGALINSSAFTVSLTGGIMLGSNSSLGGGGAGLVTIGSAISDGASSFSLTKVGASTFLLNTANTYDGGTTVSGGTLRAGVAGAIPAGALTVNGGGTMDFGTNNLSYTPVSLTFGGIAGTAALTTGTGNLTLASNPIYDAANNPGTATISGKLDLGGADRTFAVGDSSGSTNELTIAAVLSGSNGIVKTGLGVLALTSGTANTFTGGTPASAILVNQGVVAFTADNQLGALTNGITLNGGTLSQNGTTGSTVILSSLRVITVGASNGTIDIQGVAAANKILLGTANQLAGSGNVTKTGGGTFQLIAANSTFSGNWAINAGYVEAQNANALGSGSVTLNAGGELVDSNNASINNSITLSGGVLSSNSTTSGAYTGTITVSSASSIAARLFQTTSTGNSVNITGTLTGSGNLTLTGPTAGNGTVFLTGANTSGYTGVIAINPFTTLQLGGTSALANSNALTLSGGTVSFLADGNGLASGLVTPVVAGSITPNPELAGTFTDALTLSANSAITVGKLNATANSLNKSIVESGGLTTGGAFTLTVNNNNQYGLNLSGTTTMTTAAPTFSVATATASNVVQGLTLSGKLTGNFGFTKAGAGTLVLTNATNDNLGTITVTQGVLATSDPLTLGNSANSINLNGGANVSAFRATGSFSTGRTITLSSTTVDKNAIEVSAGSTLTLTSAFGLGAATNTLAKLDNGTLSIGTAAIPVSNPTWTGATSVSAGAVAIFSNTALGAGAISVNNLGSALQLSGGINIGNPLTLNANANQFGGINSGGSLQSVSGVNTYSGAITQTSATAATIGADAGATLNITGSYSSPGTNSLGFEGAGAINWQIAMHANGGLNKFGTGTVTMSVASPLYVTALNVNTGTFLLTGGATFGTAVVANTVNSGALLKIDDTSAVASRLGGTRTMTLAGGTFEYVVNGTASTESTGALTLSQGADTIQVNTGAGTSTLTFASLNGNVVGGAATAIFKAGAAGTGAAFGTANNKVIFTAAPTLSSASVGILQRGIVIDANGTNFATYNNTGLVANANGIQALTSSNIPTISSTTTVGTTVTVADTSVLTVGMAVYGPNVPAGTTIASITNSTTYVLSAAATGAATSNLVYGSTPYTDINSTIALRAVGDNVKLGTGFVTNGNAINLATRTFGSINLSGGGTGTTFNSSVPGASGTYTITSGNILSTGASTNTIGSGAIVAFGGTEGGLSIAAGNTLDVNGTITNAQNVTKGLDGNLNFNAKQYFNTGANYFTATGGGTVRLMAGGNNTLYSGVQGGTAGQYLAVGVGSTLDLNGSVQLIGDLRSPNNAGFAGSGGLITSTAAATLVDAGGVSSNWGGQISNNVFFAKGGNTSLSIFNNNAFTGGLLLMGNTTTLVDSGKFSGLTAGTPININYAGLTISNAGTLNEFDRIPDAVPFNLNGGVVTFSGRAQTASSETLGALSLAQGWNAIAVIPGGTGINSADLTFASLSRPGGSSATVSFSSTDGTVRENGQIGSNGRLLFTAAPTTSNNIIGPWAFVEREWASYLPGLGVAKLNAAGYAGYSANTLAIGGASDNIRIVNTAVTLTANATVNTLLNNWSTSANGTIDLGGNTLTLQGGGLMLTTSTATTTGSINNGFITSGVPTVGGDLYLNFTPFGGTGRLAVLGAAIKDNGIGGTVRLIVTSTEAVGSAQSVTLNALNTYSGGTVVNGGTLNIGATGTLPGNGVTLNGGALTQTAGGVINSGNVVTFNGPSTLTLTGANTLDSLVFNNNGGVTNPAAATGGVLSLTNANPISETGSNPSTVATVSGTLDFANATKSISVGAITVNGQAAAPLTAGLNVSALIQNAGQITKTGTGNLQLSATTSTFTGGVNLSLGGLIIGASGVGNTPLGQPAGSTVVSGPLGTGMLTVGAGTTLLSTGANTIGNAVSFGSSATFDGINNLTINGAAALTASSTMTVNAPQMTATLGGAISGAGFGITKNGLGVLALANNSGSNTFTGGVTLNSGTLLASGASPFGTGAISINGGLLALKNNAGGLYGNNVTLSAALTNAFIDLNNNGNLAGNTFTFGTLTSQTSTILNVSGGNAYKIRFTGTNLTAAGSAASFNPAQGLTIILPGGFNDANRPVNIGTGILAFSGNNTFTTTTNISGVMGVAPQANTITTPFGSGAVVLGNGSTLQITPTAGTLSSTGYTSGGLAGRFFSYGGGQTLNTVLASGAMPAAVVGGIPASDANLSNHPAGIMNNSGPQPNQDVEHYTGLLNITSAGSYIFAHDSDDQSTIFIDGARVAARGDGSANVAAGGGFSAGFNMGTIYLSAGQHSIVVMHENGGGGSGLQLMYSGPDTATSPTPGFQNIALGNLSYNTSGLATAGNGYLNAGVVNNAVSLGAGNTATLDGATSQFNSAVASLTLGNTSTLIVNNAQGTGFIGSIGMTTVGTGVTLNTNSGMLNLIGGVTDGGNGLTKTGTASLTLGASAGTFTGPLTVNNGTIVMGAANGLTTGTTTVGNTSLITVATGNSVPTSGASTAFTVTVTSTAGLQPGMGITGTGIGANTFIQSITNGTSYVAFSQAATTATTATLVYSTGATLDLNGISAVSGNIILNGNGSQAAQPITGALYNSSASTASVSGGVGIGAAINGKTPAIGGYGDITFSGVVSDNVVGQAWSKVSSNTLTLSGSNTFTGALSVTGGVLKLGSVNSLGTSTTNGVTFTAGAALDLAGQSPTAAKLLTFGANNLGVTGLAMNNTLGALLNNTATTSTYAGALAWTGALGIGSSSFDAANPGGDIILSAAVLNSGTTGIGINKVGQDTVTILGSVPTTTGGHNIQMGTLVLSGTAGAFTGGSPVNISSGATLRLDNTAANIAGGRLGNLTNAGSFLVVNGNLTMIGNAAGTQEVVSTATNGKPSFANSGSVITLQPNAGGGLLFNFTSNIAFARTAGATSLFRGAGLGTAALASFVGAANPGVAGFGDGTQVNPGFTGSTTTSGTNRGVLPWALVDPTAGSAGLGTSFAAYDITNGFRALNFAGGDGVTNVLTAGTNVLSTTGVATTAASGVLALNSLTLNAGAATVSAGTTLQITSGGILNLSGTTGTPNTISGAGILSTTGNAELIVHIPGTTALNISSQIAGATGGLTKADGGLVILGSRELYTGNTTVNGGTLQFAAGNGNNTIFITPNVALTTGNTAANPTFSAQVLQVNQGGTIDLNGTSQMFANINSANNLPNTGGIITNSNATASTVQGVMSANQTFAGTLTGNLNFIRSSGFTLTLESASSYTGTTSIQGGQTILLDLGAFTNGVTGTSAIALNGGALTWNDTGTQAVSNRLPASAPIEFNTGAFTYNARSGTQGAIAVGNATINAGSSRITVTPLNGGANLTIGNGAGAGLTHNLGGTVTFAAGDTNGGIGDNAHVYIANQANGIIGGWATAYQVDSFLGQSVQPGFATYTSNGIQNLNPNLVTLATGSVPPGVNARVNANLTLPTGGVTLNSISVLGTASTLTFAAGTDTLTVTSGGVLTNIAATIGASAGSGKLTAGAAQTELFLHSGSGALTINSVIADNGVSGGLNVVADFMAGNGTLTLAAPNTYLGATYLNGITTTLNATGGPAIPGNLVIAGGVSTTDSTNATTTFNQSNQIATGSTVTLKGGATLNLAGFTNTIASLVIDSSSGDLNGVGGTLLTGGGALTVSGNVTVSATTNSFLIPQLNGFLNLTSATPTISIGANTVAPLQLGLQQSAALTLTAAVGTPLTLSGGGVIALGGQSVYANGTNVTAGTTLAFGTAAATTGSSATFASIANSQVNLASGTFLDLRGVTGAIGSLSGSGTVTNSALAAGTLTTGADSIGSLTPVNTTFSGALINPFVQGLLNVTKVGNGDLNLSADNSGAALNSPNLGTLSVSGGSVTLNAIGARIGFGANTLNPGGSLILDNSTFALNDRLGGAFQMVSPTVATATSNARTLNMQGGALTIIGKSGTAVTENVATLTLSSGGGAIVLNSAGTGGVTLAITNNLGGQLGQTSLQITGANFGTAAAGTANSSNLTLAGTISAPGTQGAGAAGSTLIAIRPDIIGIDTATGVTGFVFKGANGLRPLGAVAGEYLTTTSTLVGNATVAAANAFNLGLGTGSANQGITTNTPAGSLTLFSGGGLVNALGATGGNFGAAGLETLTLGSAGILALSGNTGINVGSIASGGITMDIHTTGSSTVLNFNSSITGTTQGLVKAGDGTLNLNAAQFFTSANGSNGLTINAGRVNLAGGANTILVQPTAGVPSLTSLFMNGGTLDLGGNSQMFERISSINSLPGQAGNITSTAAANLFTSSATGTTYAGSIDGAISFYKAGQSAQSTLVLTGANSYSGSTNIQGGTLALRDSGAITGPGAININYAQLLLDNTGLSDSTSRIPVGSAINLSGGTFTIAARQAVESQTVGTVTLAQGLNQINLLQYNNNVQTGSYSFNIGNLVQSNNATVNFPNNTVVLGQTSGNPHVFLSQVSGTNFTAANLANGIIGGWAISNGVDFASYTNVGGVTALGSGISGVAGYSANSPGAALGTDNVNASSTTQSQTPASSTTLNATVAGLAIGQSVSGTGIAAGTTIAAIGAGSITLSTAATSQSSAQTITFGATDLGVTSRTINSLRVGNASIIGLASFGDIVNIGTGGLLQANTSTTIQGGQLTAGGAAATPASLYLYANASTLTVNSQIANNAASGAVVSLVRSGGGTLTLTPQSAVAFNSYASGATVLSSTSATGTSGTGLNGLFVGELVTGTGITAGTTITALTANSITLSAATTAATGGMTDLIFTPPSSTATSATTVGSTTVTTAANALGANFTPVVGMAIGGPSIPGGAMIASFTGTAATGFTLTLSQPAIATSAVAVVTVGAVSNNYTGVTVSNGGNSVFGGLNLSGLPGSIVIPGDLTVGNSSVTMLTNQGQIAATSNVSFVSGGTMTLVGTNTLNSLTFAGNGTSGGTGTAAVGTLLNLSQATGSASITSVNNNIGTTPIISGTALALTNAAPVISTSGLSPDDLLISAPIVSAGGRILKQGTGSLILSGASTFTNGFDLQAGSIIFGAASVGAPPTITSGPLGTGSLLLSGGTAGSTILSDGTLRIIGNAVSVTGGGFTFGGTVAGNSATLSGIVTLGSGANSINVTSPIVTGTISGQLTGGTNFSKSGSGILLLSAANNYGGTTTVSGGVLKVGVVNAIPFTSNLTVGAGAEFDVNGITNTVVRTLNGTGLVTNSGGVATLIVGGTAASDFVTNATGSFDGVITNAANALGLLKAGLGTQTLSGVNSFTGNVAINDGALMITNSSALGTGPKTVTVVPNSNPGSLPSLRLDGSGGAITLASTISFTTSYDAFSGVTPIAGAGAIVNVAGNNIIQGAFNLTSGGGGTTFLSDAGKLTLTGTITPSTTTRAIFLRGNGDGEISGLIVNGSTVGLPVTREVGTGNWTLSNIGNSFTGNVTVSAGTLTASGASAGTNGTLGVVNAAGRTVTVNTGGTLSFITNNIFGNGVGNANLPAVILNSGTLTSTRYNVLGNLTLNGATLTQASTDGPGSYEGYQFLGSVTVGGSAASTIATANSRANHLAANTTFTVADATGDALSDLNVSAGLRNQSADFASAAGGLTKAGAGTMTISGASTYTGATTVNAGTLAAGVASVANVSGAFGNNSAVTMANVAGATLNITGFNTQIGSLTGGGTTGGNVTLGAATLTTGGDNTSPAGYAGVISGTGGVTKIGTGTQTLAGANTYTGATLVSNGTLAVDNNGTTTLGKITGSSAANSITVNSTGTLLLGGTGSGDRIGDTTGVTLAGGTFSLQGVSNLQETAGLLTLSANSTLDFGTGNGNTLTFSGLSLGGFSLAVRGWTGPFYLPGQSDAGSIGDTQDRLLFTTLALTQSELAQISFYNDAGTFLATAQQISFGATPELVPVPEPTTILGALALLGLVGYRERRRLFGRRRGSVG